MAKPDMAFADGHIHAGFVMREGSYRADLGYFIQCHIKVFCLSLPLDNSKTADLKARINEEIAALGKLAREQNTFRLRLNEPGKNEADPPGQKITVFLNIEYFHGVFNGDPGLVKVYRDMGVKAITIINNDRDPFFSGEALTPFGRKVIALMNDWGMRIDVSHLAASQKLEVIEFSRAPVLDSHANARSVAGIDYNTPDVVLAALKRKRGSVLVSFNRNGVFDGRGETTDGVAQLANHIDHFVKRLGAGHVGIGSDYQAGGKYVAAPLGDSEVFEKIAAELSRRGYSAADVKRILSTNVLNEFADGAGNGSSLTAPAKRVMPGGKPPDTTVTVTFFGNCGFLVRAGGKKVLFDLEGPEKAGDKDAAGETYRLLAAGAPPFDGLAVVFVSHPHPDHVGVSEMAECLKKNGMLKLYSTAGTWDELKKAGAPPSWLGERVFVVAPGAARILDRSIDGMEVEFLDMLHAGAPEYVFPDLSFVIDLEGVRIFFLSDVDPGFEKNREVLERWSGRNERVDLLFSPDSNLYDSRWSTAGAGTIKRFIRPERVVAMHVDPRAIDEAESRVRKNFPAAIVFRDLGETVELPGVD